MTRQALRKLLMVTAFILFPITLYYFSPYLIIMGAFEGIVTGSFLIFLTLFLTSLFTNRLFCGWLCPAGGLGEICQVVTSKPHKGGWRKVIKYIIWFPWLAMIVFAFMRAGGLSQIDFFYMTLYGLSVTSPEAYIIFYGVIVIIVLLSVGGGRRSFCHSVCWMAPFMVLGTRLGRFLKVPQVHLQTHPNTCIHCGQCTKTCQMSLPVENLIAEKAIKSTDCILCGACVDICPKKTLHFTINSVK